MNLFTIIQGIRIRRLFALVLCQGLTPWPPYLLRFLVLLWGALPSSIFARIEGLKYGRRIRERPLKQPPVFIVGHWRTGSTYLHQLLNLHPEFTAPNMLQTSIPDHFLSSSTYYAPILRKALPATRPMDEVRLDPFEPQEEEFALIRLGAESPFLKLLFPRGKGYFLTGESFVPRGKKLDRWKKKLDVFYRKIQLETGLRIVSKNPWHSLRMNILTEMYPGARFIHITRDPLKVVPSTIRMWNIMARDNALKKGWSTPSMEEVGKELKCFLEEVREVGASLPQGHYAEIRFEALEENPSGEIRVLFQLLDLPFDAAFETALKEFSAARSNYRKNTYSLTDEERACIRRICG